MKEMLMLELEIQNYHLEGGLQGDTSLLIMSAASQGQ